MAYELTLINQRAKANPEKFILDCEEEYESRIKLAAELILQNRKNSPLVLLSGPSGSGKTTTSQKIEHEIRKHGVMTHAIGMDNYFKTVDPATSPRTPEGEVDFESPECVDFELMKKHLDRFMSGKPVPVPRYNFAEKRREKMPAFVRYPTGDDIVIVEGIHALGDFAVSAFPNAYKLYISTASDIEKNGDEFFYHSWMRLVRRIVRDNLFRGASAEYTLGLWDNVRRGEVLYIRPTKTRANFTFDSSFPYELCVMKGYFLDLFKDAPESVKNMSDVSKVLNCLEQFESIDPALIPPQSLLREFIGGGIYEY